MDYSNSVSFPLRIQALDWSVKSRDIGHPMIRIVE